MTSHQLSVAASFVLFFCFLVIFLGNIYINLTKNRKASFRKETMEIYKIYQSCTVRGFVNLVSLKYLYWLYWYIQNPTKYWYPCNKQKPVDTVIPSTTENSLTDLGLCNFWHERRHRYVEYQPYKSDINLTYDNRK